MSKTQTFKLARLAIILLFILALVAIVMSSGKQLIITKRVEVPVEVEKAVAEPSTSEILDSDTTAKPETKRSTKDTTALTFWILCTICHLFAIVISASDDAGCINVGAVFGIIFQLLAILFLFGAILSTI